MIKEIFLLFSIFFKVGSLSFGGGLAMISAVYQNIDQYNLMNYSEFINMVAISQATPGPVILNLATYIGYEKGGFLGSVIASMGAVLPSIAVVFLAIKLGDKFKENKIAKNFMLWVKPASIGLILASILLLFKSVNMNITTLFIIIATVVISSKTKISPIVLTIGMIIFGTVALSLLKGSF